MAYLDETGLAYFWQKLKTKLAAKADLASPAFTGTPTAPTPQASDSSTKLATTAYVQGAIDDNVDIGVAAGKLVHVTDAKAGVQVKSLVLYDGSGTEVTGKQVAIANKNLFRIDLLGSSVTDKGVTFTKGADGGITASGTTTGTYAATKCNIDKNALVQGRVYTLSCGGGGTVYAQLAITYNDNTTQYLAASSSHTVFMPSKPVQSVVGSIQITNSGVTVDATVYPQLELAGAASAFENNSYTAITYNGSNLPVLPAEIANLWSNDDTVANIEMTYVQNTAAAIAAADNRTTSLEAITGGLGVKPDTIALATSWTGNGPYTQVVTLTSGTPTENSKIDLQPDATAIAQLAEDGVQALYIANNNGTLTAYAIGAAPTTALTLQVTVTEVTA